MASNGLTMFGAMILPRTNGPNWIALVTSLQHEKATPRHSSRTSCIFSAVEQKKEQILGIWPLFESRRAVGIPSRIWDLHLPLARVIA